jgi:hypothetical protein
MQECCSMTEDRFEEAVASVIESKNGSTSRVQRHLRIGYHEASKYMERMEAVGVVSPANLVGRREVLGDNRVDRRVTLNECPPGLFWYGSTLGMKTEYATILENPRRCQCDAYIVASGEYFAGGVGGDVAKRGALMVLPIAEPESLLRRAADTLNLENARG